MTTSYLRQQQQVWGASANAIKKINQDPERLQQKIIEQQNQIDTLREAVKRLTKERDELSLEIDYQRKKVGTRTGASITLISASQAARIAGVSVSTVNRHLNGKVKNPRFFGKVSGNTWYVYTGPTGNPLTEEPHAT